MDAEFSEFYNAEYDRAYVAFPGAMAFLEAMADENYFTENTILYIVRGRRIDNAISAHLIRAASIV